MSKNTIPTTPYKGVRDFYPEDMYVLKHIFSAWRKSVESFGYVEYGASILEPTELYTEKSGEEIVHEQTYSFTDRGERSVTLRPEMTPTVARMIAARKRDLSFPVRWYSIPNLFRYERPQRGRLREHFQLNCDLFGMSSLDAEMEIIMLAATVMKNLGATVSDFEIRINSRKLLDATLEQLGLSPDQVYAMKKLLDKKDKITTFNEEVEKIAGKPLYFTVSPNETISLIIQGLHDRGIPNVRFDETLVRGFDYYTDIVFEIYDTHSENKRALFGGGRYDGLTTLFDAENIPAVGFGMGDVTARDFLEVRNMIPPFIHPARISIAVAEPSAKQYAEATAHQLRTRGVNVVVDQSEKKIGEKIKKAVKDGIPYLTVIGGEEMNSTTFTVKELQTGKEHTVSSVVELAHYLA